MILCPLSEFHRYTSLHPSFPAVVEFLSHRALDDLPEGRIDLPGQDFYLSSAPQARTRLLAEASLEAHRAYIDVQVVLEGTDSIGWAPLASCRNVAIPYDPGRDIVFFKDAPEKTISVGPGQLVVFFPEDAHAPLIGEGGIVRKLVVKVRI